MRNHRLKKRRRCGSAAQIFPPPLPLRRENLLEKIGVRTNWVICGEAAFSGERERERERVYFGQAEEESNHA